MITEMWNIAHPSPALADAARLDARIYSPPADVVDLLSPALAMLLKGAVDARPTPPARGKGVGTSPARRGAR